MAFSSLRLQTPLIFVVCAVAVLATALYVRQGKSRDYAPVATVDVISENEAPRSTSDSWRSQFFSIGTSTAPAPKASTGTAKQNTEPLTLTDQIGRNFFTSYVQLQQGNLIGNETAVQNAVDYTIDTSLESALAPRLYTLADVRVSADAGTAALHGYGNTLVSTFAAHMPTTDAAMIATEALEKQDFSILASIDPVITGHQRMISAMLALSVPKPLEQYHLDLLNGLSRSLYIAQGLRATEKDPMQALVALGTYAPAKNTINTALQGLNVYFRSYGVLFSAGEPGAAFSNISTISQ